jgi:aryl-alcohol dehydrogenase-like predicted oxidoreductase
MWQVAGGHGYINQDLAIADMMKYHDAGFTSWDLADIYGPAEDFIGEFRRQLASRSGQKELEKSQAFTKWVPEPRKVTLPLVEQSIDRSIRRMNVDRLDLVQFHWWEYNNMGWLDALIHLSELRDRGKIRHVGLTNFDTDHMQDMADASLKIASNQVQYSIIDRRPEVKMAEFCRKHNIVLFTYGTLCGGLLSERYLGRPEPSLLELDTMSLRKYKKMVDVWGGWKLFQELLLVLKGIADKYKVGIPNVATRYVLDKPAVAGVIVGARLGIAQHRQQNMRTFDLRLEKADYERIHSITAKSRDLFEAIGDCGDEYR